MRLAIVGSVALGDSEEAKRIVEEVLDKYQPTEVVSGGALGVDTLAAEAATRRGIPTCIFLPEVAQWGNRGKLRGYMSRNREIAERCERLVRIAWSRSKSYGSGWTRDRAAELGKPTEEFVVEYDPPRKGSPQVGRR